MYKIVVKDNRCMYQRPTVFAITTLQPPMYACLLLVMGYAFGDRASALGAISLLIGLTSTSQMHNVKSIDACLVFTIIYFNR